MLCSCSPALLLPRASLHPRRKSSTNGGVSQPWPLLAASASRISSNHSFSCPVRLSTNWKKVEQDFSISTMTKDNLIMDASQEDVERFGIFDVDPSLEKFKDHFIYRLKKYEEQKSLIEKFEGSLEEFAQGYLKFGFNREEDGVVYREWAPAAQ